ncbi:MAG TPA: hypothetical protein PLI12_04440, partial [Acetobacteraceae bacterium]|nr:hypothetical protein [Acetobacteraceae bacterium]
SHLTPANLPMGHLIAGMTQRYSTALGSPVAGHQAALIQLSKLAYREAATLAYEDAFRTIMVAFIIATLLVPFLRKVAPTPAPIIPGRGTMPAARREKSL